MGSLGSEVSRGKRAMWLSPNMLGSNPSERWGHSACCYNGLIYIFGGCRGGIHFSDVLVCNLSTTTWDILKTTGQGPGPRDSHTAVVFGHSMLVFGGTNGYKKVNDVHLLNLRTREWSRPQCSGTPPCPRESHTANVVGEDKMVIFGGSGEGESNYLNDLHILDLKTMEWSSCGNDNSGNAVRPAPCDSHSAVVVGNRIFVFGGDSGDRYRGDVRMFDTINLAWSTVDICGDAPNARAGHASVSIGTKVYVIGGVGDKRYYNDVWVIDVTTSSWSQLQVGSRCLQGRFSHTATVTSLGIAIFGGCGEDERPLDELLILQIDSFARSRDFGLEKTTIQLVDESEDSESQDDHVKEQLDEFVPKHSSFNCCSADTTLPPKRRRTSYPSEKLDRDEQHYSRPHSISSQSDHKHDNKLFRHKTNKYSSTPTKPMSRTSSDASTMHLNQIIRKDHACAAAAAVNTVTRNMIGAEVRGQVDAAFDSGYLMTASVNGKIFRGVLFAPGSDHESRRALLVQSTVSATQSNIGIDQGKKSQNNLNIAYNYHENNPLQYGEVKWLTHHHYHHISEQAKSTRSSSAVRTLGKVTSSGDELEGVILTLASPGTIHDHGKLRN